MQATILMVILEFHGCGITISSLRFPRKHTVDTAYMSLNCLSR